MVHIDIKTLTNQAIYKILNNTFEEDEILNEIFNDEEIKKIKAQIEIGNFLYTGSIKANTVHKFNILNEKIQEKIPELSYKQLEKIWFMII